MDSGLLYLLGLISAVAFIVIGVIAYGTRTSIPEPTYEERSSSFIRRVLAVACVLTGGIGLTMLLLGDGLSLLLN